MFFGHLDLLSYKLHIIIPHPLFIQLLEDFLLYIVTLISVRYLSQIHKLPTIFVMALFATYRLPFKYSQIFLISKSSILVRVTQHWLYMESLGIIFFKKFLLSFTFKPLIYLHCLHTVQSRGQILLSFRGISRCFTTIY